MTIPIGGVQQNDIAITPNGTKAYVNNNFTSLVDFDANIAALDTATNTFETIPSMGSIEPTPFSIAITPDGTKAYVIFSSRNNARVIDIETDAISAPIPTGNSPTSITVTPDGKKVYIANGNSNNVTVIDTATNMPLSTISVGAVPRAIAINPKGTRAYVANTGSNSVSVIDIATDLVITTVLVGLSPDSIAITPDGNEIYVVNFGSNNVSVINSFSNLVIATIPTQGIQPFYIIITPDGKKAYVTNRLSSSVAIIDTLNHTSNIIITGGIPTALAITPDGKKVYVTLDGANSVAVIDAVNDILLPSVANIQAQDPRSIAITPDQAPLAKFCVDVAPVGCPSRFDAMDSTSPVGTITKYFWDFGDGNTLESSSPVVQHTYLNAGDYLVTLVVTNSAGTSTFQILNPSTNITFFIGTSSVTFTNNGGPSAETTQIVTIGRLPVIKKITPSSQAVCAERRVRISGNFFTGATAVLFGSQPAISFRVISDQLIVAIAPPACPDTVDIRVITSIGTSRITPEDQFTYLPRLSPKHLKACRKRTMHRCYSNIRNILTWKPPSCICKRYLSRLPR